MESGNKVQHRENTVVDIRVREFLSEHENASATFIVEKIEDGIPTQTRQVSSLEEAQQLKTQWQNS